MIRGINRVSIGALLAAAIAASIAACEAPKSHADLHPGLSRQDRIAPTVYPALRGTIGEVASLTDTMPLRVEGYGIVADLPDTGSPEMPPPVRDLLINSLYARNVGSWQNNTENLRPEKILNSKAISAVSVEGFIPPLAPKGTTFDLYVKALPGTQTTSLAYGLLWTADLKIIGLTEGGMDTKTLAEGRGPLFCNPFLAKVDAQGDMIHRNVRTGRVMAGGMVLDDMPATLRLYTPSYRIASEIQRVINGRYSSMPPYASATDDSAISLTIPPAYHDNPKQFINLVGHMYMAQDVPGFTDRKATELLAALKDPTSPKDDIGLALEGLGRTVIPALENAYTQDDVNVRYYSARAAAALGDTSALVVLEAFARNDSSPFQHDAITSIAQYGDSLRSNTVLTNLLNAKNLGVRIAAYEGLVHLNSPLLRSFGVGRKFIVDRVITDDPAIIYATQTGVPRIALIGKNFNIPEGTLYMSADEILTVSRAESEPPADSAPPSTAAGFGAPAATDKPADAPDAEPVTLYYRGPLGNTPVLLKSNPSLSVIIAKLGYAPDPRAEDYNPKQPYIGVSYQRVLEMLDQMCKDHAIDATFVMQQPPSDDFTAAERADAQRRESNSTQLEPDIGVNRHPHGSE